MKYCGKCGFRTTKNMNKCICCESVLLDGEGSVSRKVWEEADRPGRSSNSAKMDVGQLVPQFLLLLIPLGIIVALNIKSGDIQNSMKERQENKINEMIETAQQEADEGNWDQAIETISEAKSKYEDSEALEEAYQELLIARPTALQEVDCLNSENVQYVEEESEDYFGNVYSGLVRFDASLEAYGEFNILGKYSQFSGEIHVPTEVSDGKSMWIQIYADGQIIYEQYNITELMKPKYFNVDIEGVTSLSIVTGNNGSYDWGYLDLVNTYLGIRKEEIWETEERNAPNLIFPESNSRYLDRSELEGLSRGECRLARNEIYARYGRIFQDPELRDYFYGFEWYSPSVEPDNFNEGWLNEFEVANRDLIIEYEEEQGFR